MVIIIFMSQSHQYNLFDEVYSPSPTIRLGHNRQIKLNYIDK